ncbi:hypothetical protein CR513_49016, partial [Mucuna pruriens]
MMIRLWLWKKNFISSSRMMCRLLYQNLNIKREVIDFTETFAPTIILKAIRILLAFATYKKIKLFQMDAKSEFLNGSIEKEVMSSQARNPPLGAQPRASQPGQDSAHTSKRPNKEQSPVAPRVNDPLTATLAPAQ